MLPTFREIGLRLNTDKVTVHGYDRWYEQHLGGLRDQELTLLEIGVCHGASLRLWEEFFPRAQVHGIDLDGNCRQFASARSAVWIGDQTDRAFLDDVASAAGGFDVVIDDGGHRMQQQQVSLRHLWQYLRPCGWYVIEDLHTSFLTAYADTPGEVTTVHILQELVERLCAGDVALEGSGFVGVHAHARIAFLEKGPKAGMD